MKATRKPVIRAEWVPELEEINRQFLPMRAKVAEIAAALRMADIQPYSTTEEVAEIFQVDVRTVGRWVRDKKLKALKVGEEGGPSTIRFSQSAIDAFEKRHSTKTEDEIKNLLKGK